MGKYGGRKSKPDLECVAEVGDGIDGVACCWHLKGSHGTPRTARFSPGPPASRV